MGTKRIELTSKKPLRLGRNGGSIIVALSPVWLRMHGLEKGSKVRQFVEPDGRLTIEPVSE